MNKAFWVTVCSVASFFCGTIHGEIDQAIKSVAHPEEESVTEGEVVIQGKKIPYKAVAGTYNFKDQQGAVKGSFFYIAYTRKDVPTSSTRPITFSFNGGPGSSSVWMHMGLLGPKRVFLNKDFKITPPYKFGENEFSLLDETDLVFIDPISTGYSRTPQGEDPKQFHGVDQDVKSVGEFIRLYVTRNSRWESPKFLIGASYGTLRAVELASHLFDQFNMAINGVMLISSVLDFQTIDASDRSDDLPNILFLPTYTATAWYHKKLSPELQADLPKAMEQAKNYAIGDYATALLQGDSLSDEKRQEVIAKLATYTALSPEFIAKANLRISPLHYMKEVLADQQKVVGRFDGRLTGGVVNALSERPEYDPTMDAIFSNFTGVFNEYVRNDLMWVRDEEYRVLADVQPWNYGKAMNCYFNATSTLREVMIRIPSFSVFVASGYYDLATPYFGADYTMGHLNLGKKGGERITMKYYPAGHMMYIDMPSLKALSTDLHEYILRAAAGNRQ